MGRIVGSRNRLKIPNAGHMVKYSVQSMVKALELYDDIIGSEDDKYTVKNKMDAAKAIKEFLDMAGYAPELKAGFEKLMEKEGGVGIPAKDSSEKAESEKEKEESNVLIGRFKG